MVFLAALPILVALILLVGLRWPALRAMPVCAAITTVAAYWFWQMPAIRVGAATIEAALITVSILLIVFGALFFLALLRRTGSIAVLQQSFATLSPDARIQAVLIGWILGSFLEGAAGFGTPAAITAPLLIGLGFRPVPAVVVALVGDSTAVSFGAVGTPMIIGMGQGLAAAETAPSVAAIAQQIATFDLVLGTMMPAIVVLTLVFASEGFRGWPRAWQAAPFALAVGLAQAVTSWTVVTLLGPEFPSLVGPMGGFIVALALLRTGWLVPRNIWRVDEVVAADADEAVALPVTPQPAPAGNESDDRAAAPPSADQSNPPPAAGSAESRAVHPTPLAAFTPYALLLVLLVLTRTRALPIGDWLQWVSLGVADLFATGISAEIQPLYSPGTIFILCAALSAIWLGAGWRGLVGAAHSAGTVTLKTAIALVAAIITVRIFIHSGGNTAGLEAMPLVLADALARGAGNAWPMLAPWIGALGSFIAGSAAFSNMLFALLQYEVAADLGFASADILALQGVGAAAGNMVCIHNVVAACAVAGILGREGTVIRRTALPMVVYLLVAGVLGAVL